MHRRAAVVAVLSFALTTPLAACGGPALVCDPVNTTVCEFATPEPTDPPTDPPRGQPTQQPVLPACAAPGDVALLYPSASFSAASYQNAMWVAYRSGVSPANPYLALELAFSDVRGTQLTNEIGATLFDVTRNVPAFVPLPPAGFADVYEAANLPLVPAATTITVLLVDKRLYGQCSPVRIATVSVTT